MAGSVAYDTIRVGIPIITVQRQGIGLADAATNAFIAASCDGLFVRPDSLLPPVLHPLPASFCRNIFCTFLQPLL